jgi:hypothetical protein
MFVIERDWLYKVRKAKYLQCYSNQCFVLTHFFGFWFLVFGFWFLVLKKYSLLIFA